MLRIFADENSSSTSHGDMPIGAQLCPPTSWVTLSVDHVPQIELALATMLGTELDVLLAARIVHAQLVVGRGPQHI
ncbi:hypothetical protein PpSQ1_27160, partial [Pseudomonas putida]